MWRFLRTLLSAPTDGEDKVTGRKRKLDPEEGDGLEDSNVDSDVYIVKVTKRRKREEDSTPGVTQLFKDSMSKIADWLGRKPRSFSEDFRTIPASGMNPPSQRNGNMGKTVLEAHRINGDRKRNNIPEPALSGSTLSDSTMHGAVSHPMKKSFNRYRQPSESSSISFARRSTANESVRLKEKLEYQKLLQYQNHQSPWQTRISMQSPIGSLSSPSSSITSRDSLKSNNVSDRISHRRDLSSCLDEAHLSNTSARSALLSQQNRRQRVQVPSPAKPQNVTSFDDEVVWKLPQSHKYPHSRWSASRTIFSSKGLDQQRKLFNHETPIAAKGEKEENAIMIDDVNGDSHKTAEPKVHEVAGSIVIDDDEDDDNVTDKSRSKSVPQTQQHKPKTSSQFTLDSGQMDTNFEKYQAHLRARERRKREIEEEELKAKAYEEKRHQQSLSLERQMKYQMKIFDELPAVTSETFLSDEEEEEEVLPELTDEMMTVIRGALRPGNPNDVLSEAFRLQITRRDMATLGGLNWLNDEVINFYMNMLMERGEQDNRAKVYAFNTFFYPKIMSGGHAAVKRWTKKVDIFAVHFIIIPVHLGVHWCLCVADMKGKKISYYDSMGSPNNRCLQAVLNYINDESVVKKQTPINKSEWTLINEEDNPQQMNGSDCGMFMCKYAEYIAREKEITFTQEDMPYFRQRMVYEIISKKLLQ